MRPDALVLRFRAVVLGVIAAITVLAAVSYSRLGVENQLGTWFAADDPDYVRYRDFLARFELEDTVFVVLRAPDVFARDALVRIDRLTRTIEGLPGVLRVRSLANIEDIRGTAEGIEVAPLVPDDDLDATARAALRARVLADPFFPGMIVSPDGRTTVIAAELGSTTAPERALLYDGIQAAIAATAVPGVQVHVAGWLAVDVLMDRLTRRDIQSGFPIAGGILLLAVAVLFRSLAVAVIVLGTVLVTICWTMGAFAGLGFVGSFVTVSSLPAILLALGVATGVHVAARVVEEAARTPDLRQAVRAALRGVAFPVVLTSATTAVGLGSLAVASVRPLRDLGLFAALGVAIGCFLCLTLVPLAMAAAGRRAVRGRQPRLERLLGRVADVDARHPVAIVVVAAGLAVVGAAGMTHLRPQASTLNVLPSGSPPVRAMHFIEDHFGAASDIEVVGSGPPDVFKEPAAARAVAAAQEIVAAAPKVTAAFAYTDLLRRMNQALHDGAPDEYRLPETREAIAQQLLLYETSGGKELPTLVDVAGYDVARVSGRMSAFVTLEEWSDVYARVARELDGVAAAAGVPLRFELSGDGPLWLRQNLALMDTMLRSVALALVGISAMMILLTRSVRLGLLAMVPNVLPVLLAMGLMGWAGIELDFATVMIGAIALGIAVDDTIHFLARFRRELAVDGDARAATRRALTTVGKAMVTTTIVLFVGLGSLVTSSFPPHRTFAVVMALTVAFALAGDLFLLPALLALLPSTARAGVASVQVAEGAQAAGELAVGLGEDHRAGRPR